MLRISGSESGSQICLTTPELSTPFLESFKGADVPDKTTHPKGLISDSLTLDSDLSRDYFDFLNGRDPLSHWEDIVPLTEPIHTGKTYDYDYDLVKDWSSICPQLVGVASSQRSFDAIAPFLGYRYAWSRIQMHCRLLTALEHLYGEQPMPTTVVEAGCFCSGLIHFLPTVVDATYFGIDISPVALDVCRALERADDLPGKRLLLRADFQVVGEGQLRPHMNGDFNNTLVVIANILGGIQSSWSHFPSVDTSAITAWLVSYWVNLGATVLVCERNKNPSDHVKYIGDHGQWETEVQMRLLDDFVAIATDGMCPENPLGEWEEARTGISVYTRN